MCIGRPIKWKNEIALFMIDVGAPMSVAMLEEVFAMGVRNVIVFGTCGVLDRETKIVPF